ncbi:MAG: hypothetical protein ABW220_16040 [Burkholderiaceae bacterium]
MTPMNAESDAKLDDDAEWIGDGRPAPDLMALKAAYAARYLDRQRPPPRGGKSNVELIREGRNRHDRR